MLQIVYPNIDWDLRRFKFATNGFGSLFSKVVKLFGREISPRPPTSLRKDDFAQALMVPKFKLLFDYQGPQFFAVQLLEKRDTIVREERPSLAKWCLENDFTLICVPFWFPRDLSDLLAELFALKSELFDPTGPLHAYRSLAMATPRPPLSIQRKSLSLNPNNLTAWRADIRFALSPLTQTHS